MDSLEQRFPLYNKLLNLYPGAYKKRYRQEMLQTLADMLDDHETSMAVVWARTILDLPLSAAKQQLIYTGTVMKNETPSYVKRNAAISILLLLPFFTIIFLNSLSLISTSGGFALQSLLYAALVFLPLYSMTLCAATLGRWSRERKVGYWKGFTDLRRSWLILGIGVLAFLIGIFVPFHDAPKCLNSNPIKEIRNLSETWHCIQNS
jgi:hypothetical protein